MAKSKLKSTAYIKVDNRYSTTDSETKKLFPFPNRDINPKLKDAAYNKKWSEAIYSIFISNRASWGIGEHNSFVKQRTYALGQQSTDRYKSFLLDEQQRDGDDVSSTEDLPLSRVARREGWLNVLWENLSIGPKLLDSMHGMFDPVDFDLYVNVIDANSMGMQENAKYLALVKGQNQKWQMEYKKKAGMPVDENAILPKTNQELAAIEQQGGFKLGIAKSMEKLSRHSFNVSGWSDVIKKKLVDDLVTIGRCATRDRYDQEDGMFKTEYIDPARLVIQYSDENDYSDADYAGYFRLMTISDLKKRMPTLTDETLRGIAKNNRGLFGNPSVNSQWESMYNQYDTTNNTWGWYDMKVSVFEAVWMDWDISRAIKYTNSRGNERYDRISYETKLNKKDARGEKTTTVRKPYQCSWVVGTNHVFDFGPVHMAPRPQPSVPKIPFHVEQLHGPSIIKRTIPIMDQIALLWLRYQNSVAKMIESGFAVDMGMIMNITDGQGKKRSVDEVLKMWKQTGILPFMPSRYGNYQGGAVSPVHPLPSDFLEKLNGIVAAFEFQFRMFEQTTGINPVALGQTPSPDAPVATTEAAMQATATIIKPIATALFEVKQNIGACLVSRIQIGIRVSDTIRKAYAGVIGENDINVLRMAEKSSVRYGLSMRAKPDQLFKQKLVKYVEIALASGRDGKAGIELTDAMLIEEKLWRGADISDVRNELTWLIDRNKQAISLEKKALIETQAKENQQLEQKQQQGKMMEHQMKLKEITTSEGEKRKTQRLIKNKEFIQMLIEQSNSEQAAGEITDATFDRLRIAMNIAGRVGDLSLVDLEAAVGLAEQGIASDPRTPPPNTQPATAMV
ncbi:hypothetical protein LCGC14_1750910 [marine sediment metagenome]|uniref:Portal protein n=1 Tax=marine sediment metagenome TaxID=412755 RepID=A0A0F9HRA6_9ZZZZ